MNSDLIVRRTQEKYNRLMTLSWQILAPFMQFSNLATRWHYLPTNRYKAISLSLSLEELFPSNFIFRSKIDLISKQSRFLP